MGKKVLLGMSGGIDSSVSAMLLLEQGYNVTGITFLFGGPTDNNKRNGEEAESLAKKIGIKHLIADHSREFRESVITYFIGEYKAGRTPFPCAYCNPEIKFNYLMEYAKKEKCDLIATGHYAQIKTFKGEKYIYQGADPEKDQSFFLWGLKRSMIDKTIFPLGGYKKPEIRNFAKTRGFEKLSKKKDSLGICFIEGNDYREFLKKEGVKSVPGNFVDKNGNVLGRHKGVTHYTVGQRRGLGLNLNYPVFVAKISLDDNEIVLAEYNDLYKHMITIKDYHVLDNQDDNGVLKCTVKVRYRLQETPCELHILNDQRAEVRLLKPEAMIADGQTAVFYKNDRLVGGGFIESSE